MFKISTILSLFIVLMFVTVMVEKNYHRGEAENAKYALDQVMEHMVEPSINSQSTTLNNLEYWHEMYDTQKEFNLRLREYVTPEQYSTAYESTIYSGGPDYPEENVSGR